MACLMERADQQVLDDRKLVRRAAICITALLTCRYADLQNRVFTIFQFIFVAREL